MRPYQLARCPASLCSKCDVSTSVILLPSNYLFMLPHLSALNTLVCPSRLVLSAMQEMVKCFLPLLYLLVSRCSRSNVLHLQMGRLLTHWLLLRILHSTVWPRHERTPRLKCLLESPRLGNVPARRKHSLRPQHQVGCQLRGSSSYGRALA